MSSKRSAVARTRAKEQSVTMPAPDLPTDITDMIVRYTIRDDSDQPGLFRCSLINRSFCIASQRILFSRPDLFSSQIGRFRRALISSPHLADYVRHLVLTVYAFTEKDLPELIALLHNVHTLVLSGNAKPVPSDVVDLLRRTVFQTIEVLDLRFVQKFPFSALLGCPNLHTLSFVGVAEFNGGHDRTGIISNDRSIQSSIHTLSIRDFVEDDEIHRLIDHCPLTSLAFNKGAFGVGRSILERVKRSLSSLHVDLHAEESSLLCRSIS